VAVEIDAFVAVDAACCWLTRLASLSSTGPSDDDAVEQATLMEWIYSRVQSDQPIPADLGPLIEDLMLVRSTVDANATLEYLRIASEASLERRSTGWQLRDPDGSGFPLYVRSRIPLGSVVAMRVASNFSSGAALPPELPSVACHQRLMTQLSSGVADGHVHVGAAMPFDGLMGAIFGMNGRSRVSAVLPRTLNCVDSWGDRFNSGALLDGARLAFHVLSAFDAEAEVSEPFLLWLQRTGAVNVAAKRLFEGSEYWRLVHASATEMTATSGRNVSPREFSVFESWPKDSTAFERDDIPDLASWMVERKTALLRRYFAMTQDATYALHLANFFRAQSLLHFAVTQSHVRGLDQFVQYFDNLRGLRREASLTRSALVSQGLRFLVGPGGLDQLELRTAEEPLFEGEPSLGARALSQRFLAYLHGYLSYIAGAPDASAIPLLRMPVSLIKRRLASASRRDNAVFPSRFPVTTLLRTVDELLSLFRWVPEAAQFFGGLDVAGNERLQPNWMFSLVFGAYRAGLDHTNVHCPIPYSVHAGEDFPHPLRGLRMISEALRFPVPDDSTLKIGHALALNQDAWQNMSTLAMDDAESLLDDLVWAWSVLSDRGMADAGLSDAIQAIAPAVYPHDLASGVLSPDNLGRSYVARFDPSVLVSTGLVTRTPLSSERPTPLVSGDGIHIDLLRSSDAMIRLLCMYLVGDKFVRNPSMSADVQLIRTLYDLLRPIIIDELAGSRRSIVVESCPTSNVLIGGLSGYESHPIYSLVSEGVTCTINTDDPGVFHSTIYDEYAHVLAGATRWVGESLTDRLEWLDRIRANSLQVTPVSVTRPRLVAAVTDCVTALEAFCGVGISSIGSSLRELR